MSTVLVVTPIVIASWPLITTAITAAIGTMGFAAVRQSAGTSALTQSTTREEIEFEDSEILAQAGGTGEQIVVERDGLRAIFSREPRGALRVCMEGHGYSKGELRRIGQELIDRVTQQYVYHRVVTELKERDMKIVDEEVAEDRTVKIRVRNW